MHANRRSGKEFGGLDDVNTKIVIKTNDCDTY